MGMQNSKVFRESCHTAGVCVTTVTNSSSAYCRRVFQMNFCFYQYNLYSHFLVFLRKITAFYYWLIFWSNFAFAVACGTTKIFASAVYMGMYINTDTCTITHMEVSWLCSFGGNIQNYKRANSVVKRHIFTGSCCNFSLWFLLWPYANHIISGNVLIFLVNDCEATFQRRVFRHITVSYSIEMQGRRKSTLILRNHSTLVLMIHSYT